MSKLFYDSLGTTNLKDIIIDLQKAAKELDFDFFGVGALARNVWYASNDEVPRGTKDIDFAVYVPNSTIYNQLKDKLIKDYDYADVPNNSFCLNSPYGIPLDLLPFGEAEIDHTVEIDGEGLVSISLAGFSDTYMKGLVIKEIEDEKIKVCTIPSVVLLKLIAYDDRPENRPNDPIDIDSIMSHYPDIEFEAIWTEEYAFLYENEAEDNAIPSEKIGVAVLGYEISKIIHGNSDLTTRILHILDKAINLDSELAQQMIQDTENETIETKTDVLTILKRGIEDGLKK
ncbi:hypothetical protein [Aureispira sp. CCB-E]|uniref:hypothetical protein n=1 Tax=Aureispira sp. CCB-E TaxID=3051121 RepID=UPI002869119E|nr:hypothetical protein [Aureispira sp. CCB-E]WMX14959.1 hypothetical protein QP953_01085 [Aureispira sp. CCB-E]